MKKSMRMLALVLSFVMVLGLFPTARAEQAPVLANADDIVVYYTNDVHTYIDGGLSYDNIADLKTETAKQAAGVLLVDAGDAIQGTAYGSMDKGETIIELMNASGYDIATLGNHEFDYGMERMLELVDKAEYDYISSNFYHIVDGYEGSTVLPALKIVDFGETRIAFVGITTPESFTKSTPAYFQDENGNYIYGIHGGTKGGALYYAVQDAIDTARGIHHADVVIALGHLGDDKASKPWTSEEVIANTYGLSAFIDGHSHSTVPMKEVKDMDGRTVILTQTGEYFGAIGKMVIKADGSISTELVTEWTGSDETVKAIKDEWMTEIDTQLGQVIGSAEVTFDNYDANGNRIVRKQETNTGDFCADALYYLFDNMGLDVDVAIMNGGGVRNKAITGELSYKTMKAIHTFGNVACLQTVTGQQIVDALEWGARQTPEVEVGGFLHVAGLKYDVDATITSTVQMDEKGVWTGAPTGEYRVKNVQIFNKTTGEFEPIDLAASYNLAGYNYTLRDLGDGFAMFDGAVNVLDYVMEDYMVLANYVQAFEGATVKGTNSPLNVKYPTYGADYSTTAGSGRIAVTSGETVWDGKIVIGGLENNLWMTKYGNVYTDCAAANFTEDLGLAWGDLVTVKFLDQELILPVVPTYSYVDSGKPAVILGANEKGNPTGFVSLAINMGNFAETYGIAKKMTDENGNWYWVAFEGVEFPIEVTFELYEKEGYMAEYLLHELTRTNNREDYAHLTDAQFANFRQVTTTGMGTNLYRSSSPINPEIGRSTYAMAEMEKAGVTVVLNLADTYEEMFAYDIAGTYYNQQDIAALGLGVDFSDAHFRSQLAYGLGFLAANPGTYLVHCNEGKDRAGFVSALLECLMGASAEEVVADYMVTYYNYYGIEPGTEKYNAIASSNIIKSLQTAFGIEDLYAADLAAEAAEYLAEIGMPEEEIAALKVNLAPAAPSTDAVIYYTNDVHTYIDGTISYDNIAWLKQNTDAADVLLVDAGDHIQGTAYGSMDKGETIVKLMEAAGYDLATLGNHEFDYGMERALEVALKSAVPYVSANFYHEKDGVVGDSVLDAYKVFELANGLKVAFVGLTTPETFTKSTPAYFQDENGNYIYGIAGGTDGAALYAAAQKAIDAAAAEADIVIALGHLGDDPASQPWTSEELIANTTGLDAFIDGHSHSTVVGKTVSDKNGNAVLLTQTGEYFGAIGKMTITAEGTITTELVTEVSGSDEAVKAIKDAWMTEIDTKLGEVIGHLDVTLDNYDADGNRLVRKQETNTGAFAADALYYLFDNMGLDVDVAIMNGGGVRNKAVTGDFSYLTAKSIHTFGNVACLQTITGQQLLDALEWGAKNAGSSENGGFLHVSGITYEIHTYIPSTVQSDEKGVWVGGPTGEYRVKNVKINQNGEWVDLDLNANYNLAGYNYTLRDLGDGFAMFDGAVNVLDYVMEDYMVLANYIKSFPVDEQSGLPTVTAENSPYGAVNYVGRITQYAEAPIVDGDLVIYYTNDVHTYIDGTISYDNLAWLKQNTDAAEVLLVDAGDAIQGTAYGSMDKGETIIKLMNAAGYDLATLGNHEFDYGMTGAMNAIEWANFPYVSANFYHEKDGVPGETVLAPYKVFEIANGLKVAFIGITTPESFTKSTPAYFQDGNGNYIYGIAGGQDGKALYAAVQNAIDNARMADDADIIIALGHLGDDPASQPWTSEELIANTWGLDAFIDGHSHSTVPGKKVYDKNGDTVLLTQTGEYFGAIGKMTITNKGEISTELITEVAGSDETVKAIKDEWMIAIDTQLGEVFGYTDIVFDNYDANGNRLVRKHETNTGAFAADALYYLFDNMGLDVDVAIMNGGGVRNKAITGQLSYKTMKEIHTFGNVACLQTITGQQLLDALEWGAKNAPDAENGGFLHVSGVTYYIDTNIPSTVQSDEKGVWVGGPTGEYRVRNVKINQNGEWVDLDLNANYNLAGYNYTLRDLGDGFAMFDGAVNVLDYVMEDYMVLANYVKSFPVNENGLHEIPTTDSRYNNVLGEGRITIVKGFEDVPVDSFYYESVLWAVGNGITTGATETTFNPNGDCQRAAVVTFLWRAAGEPKPTTTANPFGDVKETDFFYDAVLWAVEKGITNGLTETTFGPYENCNRAQVVTFLWRANGKPASSAEVTFTDVVAGAFYDQAVAWAVEKGITNGMGDGTFGVERVCNRAQVVTFLYRTAGIPAEEPEVQPEPSAKKYPVLLKAHGGTINCSVTEAAPGEKVYFTAIPDPGKQFTQFKIFDPNKEIDLSTFVLAEGENENEYYFIMVAHEMIVDCVFE